MKKLFVLFIAVIMIFSLPSQVMATDVSTRTENVTSWAEGDIIALSDLYTMATYYDTNFYSGSLIKQISLEKYCVSITYRGKNANDSVDIVRLIITDLNGNGYSQDLRITLDGNSYTMSLYLPAGNYNVHVLGSLSILHTTFAVNFKSYA